MRRINIALAVFLLIFIITGALSGCKSVEQDDSTHEQSVQLNAPENLRYENGIFKWSIVDNASGYVLAINLDEFSVETNSFDSTTLNLMEGEHSAKVRSVGRGEYASSDFSEEIHFIVEDIDSGINYGNMAFEAYIGNPTEASDFKLSNSINLEDKYYVYYFDLGTVEKAPVYSSVAYKYEYDIGMQLSFDKLTSESLSETTSNVHETIDTHSYTGGFTLGFEQEVELSAGFFKVAEINATFNTSQETDHHWTNNWGTTVTTSESTAESYVTQYSNGTEITIDFSENNGFTKGYTYRVSFYETVRVYGVLIFDVEKQAYTVAYQSFFESNQKNFGIEKSENGYFEYNQKTLTFDIDKAIEIAKNTIPEYDTPEITEDIYGGIVTFSMPSNVLRFDFSSFQESGSLNGFGFEFYKDGILTINPAIEGNMIYAVEIVGAFKHADKNGKIIEQPIENLSIRFADHWERDIVLTIRDLAFQAKDQLSAIQATGNLNLNVFGENLIIGKDAIRCGDLTLMGENEAVLTVKGFSGGVGENGSMGINCSNLVIAELTLSVSGGHGGDSAGYNIAGNKGGDGILCSSVFIDNSTVCITGGNGGNGHIGKAAPTMQSSENEKIHGSRGGEGGIGLRCQTLQLKGTSLTLQGGNGGAGGAGADGTEGAGKSGDGTNGGNGGDGGGALAVSEMPTESDSSVGYTAGKGGKGGKGGSKGTGWFGMQMGKDGEDGIAGNDGEEIRLI